MPMIYKFTDKRSYALVETSGTQETVNDILTYCKDINDFCSPNGLQKILLDERQMKLKSSMTLKYFEAAEKIAVKYFRYYKKIACVPNGKNLEQERDYELFAQNNGMPYKTFTSLEEAMQWLET